MDKLELQMGEVVILHNQDVRDVKADTTIELFLTSKNVIIAKMVKKGLLKKEKIFEKYPFEQILLENGRPQIAEAIPSDEDDFCEGAFKIGFSVGAYTFELNEDDEDLSKRAARQWVNCVTILVTGIPYGNKAPSLGVGDENNPDTSAYAAYYYYQNK